MSLAQGFDGGDAQALEGVSGVGELSLRVRLRVQKLHVALMQGVGLLLG